MPRRLHILTPTSGFRPPPSGVRRPASGFRLPGFRQPAQRRPPRPYATAMRPRLTKIPPIAPAPTKAFAGPYLCCRIPPGATTVPPTLGVVRPSRAYRSRFRRPRAPT